MSIVEAPPGALPPPGPAGVGSPAEGASPRAVLSCNVRESRSGMLTLRDLEFEVARGEAYGLLGPRGAGKTAVVRLVCGVIRPDDGEVLVLGRPVSLLAPAVRHAAVGYAPECAVAMPRRSIADNLRFWGRMAEVPALQARTTEALALAGLEDKAGTVAERCSRGVQRRLALAVAVLHRPRLVVLDDPLAGIDADSADALLMALARLRSRGTAILCTSTREAELAWLCDRVGRLDAGRLHIGP